MRGAQKKSCRTALGAEALVTKTALLNEPATPQQQQQQQHQ